MKTLYVSLFLWAGVSSAFGTVRTVCNMPYSPGQYTTFAAAHTAAVANDTLYIHGSNINYGAITISKQLVIIGTGHNPAKQVPMTSNFSTITIGTSNIQLHGLTLESLTSAGPNTGVTIKRCKIIGNAGIFNMNLGLVNDNWLIEGCVFSDPNHTNLNLANGTTNNTTIRNNIFCASGMFPAITSNSTATTPFSFSINNNLFLGTSSNTLNALSQATISNNIFYRSNPQFSGMGAGVTVNNNISFGCVNNNFAINTSNNLVNVNPQFVNFPLAGALFDYSHDYRLASGSPGAGTGNDGTDRGVYGAFGYKFNMTGEPAIAEILTFNITSPTVIQPGGTLNISVTSKRIK